MGEIENQGYLQPFDAVFFPDDMCFADIRDGVWADMSTSQPSPGMQRAEGDDSAWVRKIPWRRDRLPTPVFLGFSGGSDGKESACNVGNLGSIPGLGRSPGEGNDYPLQYSGLQSMGSQRVVYY